LTVAPPVLPANALLPLLSRHWGLEGRLSPLTSERDLNFRLDTGAARYVVKLANPAEPAAITDFQSRAFLHVAARDPALPVPRLLHLKDGRISLPLPQGRLRVLGWLDGTPLQAAPRTAAQSRSIGQGLARLTAALADFDHPAADHVLLWDIRHLPRLAELTDRIADLSLRAEVADFIAGFSTAISPRLDRMPRQIVHNDFNPHNLLVGTTNPDDLTGILDFGDMVRTPRVCDLAVAASYHAGGGDIAPMLALVSGYARVLPLRPDEIGLLYDLITARMITTLTITAWRASLYPANAAYILRNAPSARKGLAAFRALGRPAVTKALTLAAKAELP
jgi:hydroxylysine kinase